MVNSRQFLAQRAPAVKFPKIGAGVAGTVEREPEVQQQRGYPEGELLFWPNGDPKNQMLVTLATKARDPDIEDDDGMRTLYVKGRNLELAVKNAIRKVRCQDILPGGFLTVTYVRDGDGQGLHRPKVYEAAYAPPQDVADGVSDDPWPEKDEKPPF